MTGLFTALVTPFKDDAIDETALVNLVNWQIQEGNNGLVILGTTGENPTLSDVEYQQVIGLCLAANNGRVPLIVGVSSNDTVKAIKMAKLAENSGATTIMVTCPYYNKPSQAGIFEHYRAIHDAVHLPILLYNVPSRTGANISDETIVKLSHLPNIVGIKDATGDLLRPLQLKRLLMEARQDLLLYTGNDDNQLAFMAHGGDGCISVVANLIPKQLARIVEMAKNNQIHEVLPEFIGFIELIDVMFCESNPAPVKFALELMGKCRADLRLPLVGLAEESKEKVRLIMKKCGLI